MSSLAARLLDLLFPPRCVACGGGGGVLCATCRASIKPPAAPLCPRCGRSLEAVACPTCARGEGPHALAGLRVAARYEGAVREAIHALKYHQQRRAAEPLGALLASAYREAGWDADLVMPIPLHAARERDRGYNQSLLLARACAVRIRLPLEADALIRWRPTVDQIGLARLARQANVRGAFRLATPRTAARCAGRSILLLDDVTTTGSTLDAAAAALVAADAARVWGLAVARPTLHGDAPGAGMATPSA